jgi:hypothetical protein
VNGVSAYLNANNYDGNWSMVLRAPVSAQRKDRKGNLFPDDQTGMPEVHIGRFSNRDSQQPPELVGANSILRLHS